MVLAFIGTTARLERSRKEEKKRDENYGGTGAEANLRVTHFAVSFSLLSRHLIKLILLLQHDLAEDPTLSSLFECGEN